MYKKLSLIILLFVGCLIISCGGGGGDGDSESYSNVPQYDPTGKWVITNVYNPVMVCQGNDYDFNDDEIIYIRDQLKNDFEELYKKSTISVTTDGIQFKLIIENDLENEVYDLKTTDRTTYTYSDTINLPAYGYNFEYSINGVIIVNQNTNTGEGTAEYIIKVKGYDIKCNLIIEFDVSKLDVT